MSHTVRGQTDRGKNGNMKTSELEMLRQNQIGLPHGLVLRGTPPAGNGATGLLAGNLNGNVRKLSALAHGTQVGAPQARTGGPRGKL